MAALDKTWSGENYWFWARRVLRKLRHGLRRAHISGAPESAPGDTPAHPADGAAARRQHRHGGARHGQLRPRGAAPHRPARRLAQREGPHRRIGRQLRHRRRRRPFPISPAAIGDLNYVVATTARQRPLKKPVLTPEEAVAEMRERFARGEKCGILFGRERNGLETGEVAIADATRHDPGQFPVRLPQFGPGRTVTWIRLDARQRAAQLWAASRITKHPFSPD